MARAALLQLLRSSRPEIFNSGYRLAGIKPCPPLVRCLHTKPDEKSDAELEARLQREWAILRANLLKLNDTGSQGGKKVENGTKRTNEVVYIDPDSGNMKLATRLLAYPSFSSVPILAGLYSCAMDIINTMEMGYDPCTGLQYHISPWSLLTNLPLLGLSLCGATVVLVTVYCVRWLVRSHSSMGPYVHKLRWVPGLDRCEVDMLSWYGMCFTRTIKFADITQPVVKRYVVTKLDRPYAVFMVNGKRYYIESEEFDNMELLAKLTPDEQVG